MNSFSSVILHHFLLEAFFFFYYSHLVLLDVVLSFSKDIYVHGLRDKEFTGKCKKKNNSLGSLHIYFLLPHVMIFISISWVFVFVFVFLEKLSLSLSNKLLLPILSFSVLGILFWLPSVEDEDLMIFNSLLPPHQPPFQSSQPHSTVLW